MSETLYDRLGGASAIDAAVDLLYKKVLVDDLLKDFFTNTDMQRQRNMQKAFLTKAFGGPDYYTGRDMRKAHQRPVASGMGEEHFNRVILLLGTCLIELGVNDVLVGEVAAAAETLRDDVLNR